MELILPETLPTEPLLSLPDLLGAWERGEGPRTCLLPDHSGKVFLPTNVVGGSPGTPGWRILVDVVNGDKLQVAGDHSIQVVPFALRAEYIGG